MTDSDIALEIRDLSKAFDGKPALDKASFSVKWGEVHALLGENGAGKSTIMNVASGIYSPDEGQVFVAGSPKNIRSPAEAADLGIGMVHQHYRLVKRFTAAQNILLCCGAQLGITTHRQAADAIHDKAQEVGFSVHPHNVVGQMSIAEQQRTEIIKVLLLGAKIVILDEPTAVLTDQESQAILAFTRRLAESNHAVILITHKLREVTAFSDRVTVMRQGETVLSGADTADLDVDSLARHMVGENVGQIQTVNGVPGEACLSIRDLCVSDSNGGLGVNDVSLEVRHGEILGIAGVGGNGQQQLADALMGLLPCAEGRIILAGEDITSVPVNSRRSQGLRVIPSDRFASGLIGSMTVAENLALTTVPTGAYGNPLSLSRRKMQHAAEEAISQHNIHGATPTRPARLLSGGNAQKLLLARELSGGTSVLVAHSPTRGLDVKACHAVHSLIKQSVEMGVACLLISEDLEEIMALSNRIAVMSRGQIVGECPAKEATPEKLGSLMMGHA
jgi:simple sugar transport system ATP-binding protein